jgi:hypothetical protein
MTVSQDVTVQGLAREAYGWFESALRVDGDEDSRYIRTRDGSPEWLADLCYAAHGDMFPDDWRYDCIAAAVEAIAESGDPEEDSHEFADGYVDVYNGARLAWLSSRLNRASYVDEACETYEATGLDTFERIGLGQYAEASEVYGLVLQFLEERVDVEEVGGDD